MRAVVTPARHRHVIINADDFGLSSEINDSILKSSARSLISSATIMANMPPFEKACALVRNYKLNGKIGLYLNFSAGKPLTGSIARYPRFCNASGCWRPRRQVLSLAKEEQAALNAEIERR